MKEIPGVMWEFDHQRPLTMSEYKYWQLNVLPFGWSIISEPKLVNKIISLKVRGEKNNGG